jgi:type I restriction enzyme S subunit
VDELVDTGVPFYRGTEIGQLAEGQIVQPRLFITQEHFKRLEAQTGRPRKGDLLLPSICPDGRIYVVKDEKPFYFKDARVLWIKVDGNRIDGVYLKHYLKQLFLTNYPKIASGTTFAELKIVVLQNLDIHAAPLVLQRRFAAIVESIERQKDCYDRQRAQLDNLFSSLQHRAFAGAL